MGLGTAELIFQVHRSSKLAARGKLIVYFALIGRSFVMRGEDWGLHRAKMGSYEECENNLVIFGVASGRGGFEIEMMVVAAGGIEGGVARGAAGIALKIGGNGEDGAAGAAEDGGFVEFCGGPGDEGVVGESVVAIFAGVEKSAAFHFDGDDVE
jgi:hypothetical protein